MKSILLFVTLGIAAQAQPGFEYWPGTRYHPAVPTLQKIAGFEVGQRLARPEHVVQYFEALQSAVPKRFQVLTYGQSWERRPLIVGIISSEPNLRRLSEIQAGIHRLADPRRTSPTEMRNLVAHLPVIVMLTYAVHGNEISCVDAALQTAYHLLAAQNSPQIDEILKNIVVIIDPLQNPDGRNRFVHHYEITEGLEPDGFRFAAERDEPWPGGRSNHYQFDLNRDWFAMTQPETQARIKLFLDWLPLVTVDLHEMGSDSTYFFAPGAAPYNPNITVRQREALVMFGRGNARRFDEFGFSYFTREVFDEFYPGYGASWPYGYGGVGMTYENASVRGLKYVRPDGSVYDYPSSVQRHFVAAIATLETAAKNRQQLLENFYQFRQSAIEEGRTGATKEYVLVRRGDVSAVDKLAQLLVSQGIEVFQASTAFSATGQEFPAGSYRVPLAQPMGRMVRNYLDLQTPMEKEFLAEQERRRARRLRDEIYDVTAWSLPLLYNIDCVGLAEPALGTFLPVRPGTAPSGRVLGGKATVAYLVPWGFISSARLLSGLLRENVRVWSADRPFSVAGRKYPAGSLIVPVRENSPSLHDTLLRLTGPSGAEVIASGTSWVDEGINFGSNKTKLLRRPRVAMAWDAPTSSLSAGHTRWLLERQYGYPVTIIRTPRLAVADLSRFDVLILPEGAYGSILSGAANQIKSWVQQGGTLIGLGSALTFLTDPRVGLLSVHQESLARAATESKPTVPADGFVPGRLISQEEEFVRAIEPEKSVPDDVPGVLVRAKVDQEHWLTVGVPETVHVLISGRAIYTPIRIDQGVNAAIFRSANELVASGYLWEENRQQLAFKPFLLIQPLGRGHVIGFTADPNFRGYMDGLNLLFLNAVFRSPAHSGIAQATSQEAVN